MINFVDLEEKIKNNKLENCYLFCGCDEGLIKEYTNKIIEKTINKDFKELNLSVFDGNTVEADSIINACETLPFMDEKRAVLVYRAALLEDKEDRDNKRKFDEINKYMDNLPAHCVLIMYYIFESDRDKPSNRLKKLDKKAVVVRFDKLKGHSLQKKVKALFEERNKDIDKVELGVFCNLVDNDLNIITNEIEKLCAFTDGRAISKEDILLILPPKNDDDIFRLVDFLSQKRPEQAIEVLNKLMFKGEKVHSILAMIERQFKLLFNIKLGIENGKSKDELTSELRLNPYICEKMITQSKKFTLKQIKHAMDICLKTEKNLKSFSTEDKIEMELLIINTIAG